MDIQANELAELLKLAGVAAPDQGPADLEQELELPMDDSGAVEIELPVQEPELSSDDEVALQIGDQEIDELKQTSADTKRKNKGDDYYHGEVQDRPDLVAQYNKKSEQEAEVEEDLGPAQAYSYDDPEARDDAQEYYADAAADAEAEDDYNAEEEFLKMIGAEYARPEGEDMQQRGREHTYDYETNPEDGIHNQNDMMNTGTRVEYRDDADMQNGYEAESVEADGSEEDLQNGYGDINQPVNPTGDDPYGNDKNEKPVDHRDDNPIQVEAEQSEKEKYPSSYNQGVKDGKAGTKCDNVSDRYAHEGSAYNQGYSDGESQKQTESIHESLVYKYREFNG